jgi:hypothetical protein
MNKQGYPRGNPVEDCQKLQVWWEEEIRKCGLAGAVTVDHANVGAPPPAWSVGKRLFESLVMNRGAVVNSHLYGVTIPVAQWPLEVGILTTDSGMITEVVFRAVIKAPVAGEVLFKKSLGMFSEKFEVLGPGADRFKDQKPLLKLIKGGLNRRYDPPMFGFVASSKTLELSEASLTLKPGPAGGEAIIRSTPLAEKAFIGHNYSLGLKNALDILLAIEELS